MIRLLYFNLLLFLSLPAVSQTDTSPGKGIHGRFSLKDSIRSKIGLIRDSLDAARRRIDPANMTDPAAKEVQRIVEVQKKHTDRQKRNAILRILFGLAMLAVLVVGWRRKRKKDGATSNRQ